MIDFRGMPSLDCPLDPEMYITSEELQKAILTGDNPCLVVDCRSAADFAENHIKGAISVPIPASVIMLRRLANGKMSIPSIIRGIENREKFNLHWKTHYIVLYDNNTEIMNTGPCVLSTLFRRLLQDGCRVVCLQGERAWTFYLAFTCKQFLLFDWIQFLNYMIWYVQFVEDLLLFKILFCA